MIPIEDVLARELPETIKGPMTMDQLAEIKAKIKKALPPDSSVELTTFMNTVSLTVYCGRTYHRTAVVK